MSRLLVPMTDNLGSRWCSMSVISGLVLDDRQIERMTRPPRPADDRPVTPVATNPRIYIRASFTDDGRTDVVVSCGAMRLEMSFWSERMPIDETDRDLITLVIAQLRMRGVSAGRIRSTPGRLAVYALAKHIRYSMESDAEIHDFGGLPIVADLPKRRAQLAGITKVEVAT